MVNGMKAFPKPAADVFVTVQGNVYLGECKHTVKAETRGMDEHS